MAGRPRPEDVQALFRLLRIVFVAMLVSVACYWLVLEVISASLPVRLPGPEKTVLRLVALGLVLLVLYLRFSRIGELLAPTLPLQFSERIRKLRTHYLGSYVLSETIALLGLILKVFGATRLQAAPFFVVAVALLFLCYPRLPEDIRG